jgi:hypothetical protein
MQYREEQRYIQDHKEELERLLSMEQEQMSNQVPGSLWEAFGMRKKDGEEGQEVGKGQEGEKEKEADGKGKVVEVEVKEGGRSS